MTTTKPPPSDEQAEAYARDCLEQMGYDWWQIQDILERHSPAHVLATERRYTERLNDPDAPEVRSPRKMFRLMLSDKGPRKGKAGSRIGECTKDMAQRWHSLLEAHAQDHLAAAREMISTWLARVIALGSATDEQRRLYVLLDDASDEQIIEQLGDPQWAAAYRALVGRMATAQAALQEG